MVSHELRTPLTSIKGSADTLLEESGKLDPAEMRQFFRIIRDQTLHMRGLISNLLDVARIETGTLPVDPQPGRGDAPPGPPGTAPSPKGSTRRGRGRR